MQVKATLILLDLKTVKHLSLDFKKTKELINMRDLIMNLQTNCPPNHFIQLETVKDDMKFKIRKNDLVRFKGKLIYLHHKGVVTCIVNQNTLSLCAIVRSCLKMSKPARLYPKPEPVTINSRNVNWLWSM